MKRAIYNEPALHAAIGDLRAMFREHGFISIKASIKAPRTLTQNATAHGWYEQVSKELGEDTADGVRRECKLIFGVPILRADDEEFRDLYDGAIKHTMTHEQKLAVMGLLPVTSLMNTGQLSRYLTQMQNHYATRSVLLETGEECPL